jgi:mono/diheme cytochrome c family protein
MMHSTTKWLAAAAFSTAFVLGACDSSEPEEATTAAVVPDSAALATTPTTAAPDSALLRPPSTGDTTLVAAAAPVVGGRSVMDRVYTSRQAARGQELFETVCVECHTPDYFTGEKMAEWKNRPIGEIYQFSSTMMPANAPGTLAPQDYIDVIAYWLRQNGYPTGNQELPPDQTALNKIQIVPPPGH